jgi:hypothetical protein
MSKTIVTPFEFQCEILMGMDEMYNTDEYPILSEFFRSHDLIVPLAYAFCSELIEIEGVTDEFYRRMEECYAELLEKFGIEDGQGFRSFYDFHLELEKKSD